MNRKHLEEEAAAIRVIVAGGREFNDYVLLRAELNMLIAPGVFDRTVEIVSGAARGTDQLGERYAKEYGLGIKRFPVTNADWKKWGKSAGPIRNEQMAKYATHCVCFWDGASRGTNNMIELAKKHNLKLEIVKY